MKKITPMQRQYYKLKAENPDAILLYRLGDFYEMFDEDAVVASTILGIALTARNKGLENEMKMCGIPHHASEAYINKLTRANKKVAICEQCSDPNLPGIVERKVVQIITPGTILSENVLDEKKSNYIAAIIENKSSFGLAYTDISTGEFSATQINSFDLLQSELQRLQVAELILDKKSALNDKLSKLVNFTSFWFIPQKPEKTLQDFFKIPNLTVFYIENEEEVVKAAALLLDYVLDTQKGNIKQITHIKKYSLDDFLPVDYSTLKNLEVFSTMQNNSYKGSLMSVIDKTITAGGGRKLQSWILKPLQDIQKIQARLDQVEQFTKNHEVRDQVRIALKNIRDLERLLGKTAAGKANPKDLLAIKESLQEIPKIKELVRGL